VQLVRYNKWGNVNSWTVKSGNTLVAFLYPAVANDKYFLDFDAPSALVDLYNSIIKGCLRCLRLY